MDTCSWIWGSNSLLLLGLLSPLKGLCGPCLPFLQPRPPPPTLLGRGACPWGRIVKPELWLAFWHSLHCLESLPTEQTCLGFALSSVPQEARGASGSCC